jgi:hypothetical protein
VVALGVAVLVFDRPAASRLLQPSPRLVLLGAAAATYQLYPVRAARDDGRHPLRERLALFAAILLVGVPHAVVFEAQRGQPERGGIDTVRGSSRR